MTHQEMIDTLAGEFELAFLATGLTPVRGSWGDGSKDACMVTALDVSEHGKAPVDSFDQVIGLLWQGRSRVADYLARRFPELGRGWCNSFVSYCITGFDGGGTFPNRWLKRNASLPVRNPSPKLMGIVVGDLVMQRVFSTPQREMAPQRNTFAPQSPNVEATDGALCLV